METEREKRGLGRIVVVSVGTVDSPYVQYVYKHINTKTHH